MHCMTWYNSMCGIMTIGLLYRLNDMVKYVCYMDLGSNSYFMDDTTLTGGHYRMDIISGVSHVRSDLVMPLAFCTAAYNI
jgi:hypothetical protein